MDKQKYMSSKLKNARIKFFLNIVVPSILAVLLFVVTLFFVVVPYFEDSMMDRKREMITELTNTATSILAKYHKDEIDGILSREEAQSTAISRIQYLRYGEENKDYFWITDMQPVMIVHPYRPDLNGKDLSNFEDPHGKKMFVEFVNVVKKDKHGYVEYMWQWKDDPKHIVPKLSYVESFEPWGWIIGTGIYIEDVKAEIAVLTRRFTMISIIISFIITLILMYVGRQSFNIERKRINAEAELNQSREKYRSLVDASTDGLLMWMDGQITFVNEVFEKMTGKAHDEIAEHNIESVLNLPSDIKSHIDLEDFSFPQQSIESKVFTVDNKQLDVVLNVNPIKFYGRDAVVFSVKDVSSDILAREENIQNKEKFQYLMDSLNQGIFRTSLDQKGRFIEANQTALQVLGYKSFAEINGLYILDFLVEKEDKLNFRSNLLNRGFVKNRIIKLKKKNGEQIFASVSLVIVNDSSGPRFCDGLIQDVTTQMNTGADSLNNSYTAFMQFLSQPALSMAAKPAFCSYNIDIKELGYLLNNSKSEIAVISGPEKEILGFISDASIRSRALNSDKFSELKAYNIMSSPLKRISENSPVIDVLFEIENAVEEVVFLENQECQISGYLTKKEVFALNEFLPVKIITKVSHARSGNDLKTIYNEFITALIPLIEVNTHSTFIFNNLSMISEAITRRLIEIAIIKVGEPPAKFSFITMGSVGRMEQTLNTDQDNAIIFEDTDTPGVKKYFDELAQFVSSSLDEIGYTFCKGGIMAMNTDYCQPFSVWKTYFSRWINNGNAKDLLDICIFFDFRLTYGEESFVKDLRTHISHLTERNPAYLLLLAQNNLKLKPQVGFWGNILIETAGAPPETVNIKDAIAPIVNFSRIYALRNGLTCVNTTERLKILLQKEIIQDSSYKNITQAFDVLGMMRLNHQASLFKNNLKPDNLVSTRHLSELDKAIIKKVLAHINTMLSKLSYDFKGTM